jgi:ABC-2 type transport system ATP-binding protein
MNIKIINVSKHYQNHKALDEVSLNIPSGSIYGLIGPNGAGKTSLIRILTQITKQDSGEILMNNEPLNMSHIKRIGYLPEERGLYKKMTVGEQLLFFAQLKGLSINKAKKELKYWSDKLDILKWLPKKTEELSKGMQQKVQFIATIINKPDLLILDEPFSGFDPINAQAIIEEIKYLNQQGTTIIFSTHRMESIELLCDYIGMINKSKKVLEGNITDIKKQYKQHVFKVQFNGSLPNISELTVLNQTFLGSLTQIHVKPNTPISNNKILELFLKHPIEIVSFEEQLPSMEEIFINTVNHSNNA